MNIPHKSHASKVGRPPAIYTGFGTPLDAALAYRKAGYSVIPIRTDGSKAPALNGTNPYLTRRATEAEVRKLFDRGDRSPGVALACGSVSRGLTVIDFDANAEANFPIWEAMVEDIFPDLLGRLAVVKSPNGIHVWHLCPDAPELKTGKLAMDPAARSDKRTLIETMGDGNYALVPGCPPACHDSGRQYVPVSGVQIADLQPIRADQREFLLVAARTFDRRLSSGRPRKAADGPLLPGEDFDQRGPDWEELLDPHSWRCIRQDGPVRYWLRPGKGPTGWSATTGHCHGQDGADLLRIFSSNAEPFEEGKSYGKFRAYVLLNHSGNQAQAVKELARQGYGSRGPIQPAATPPDPAPSPADRPVSSLSACPSRATTDPGDSKPSQARKLLYYSAEDGATYFRDEQGTAYVRYQENGIWKVARIGSQQCKDWLVLLGLSREDRIPTGDSIAQACSALAAMATQTAGRDRLYVRVAGRDGSIFLDLGDDTYRAVAISPEGWKVIDNPPVHFLRPKGQRPLPVPRRGGQLDGLAGLLNLPDSDKWMLACSWLLAALRPTGPYPLLILTGQQGAAKSTFARIMRDLIDPHAVPLQSAPPDGQDLAIIASNQHFLAFDNLSSLSADVSDALCRLATGGGFATRKLYSDDDLSLFNSQRPVILTSIDDIATRGDLLDRALLLELPPIPREKRLSEDELWTRWHAARPGILGGLLDAAVSMLAALPAVKLPAMPRMADFARLGCAAGPACGWSDLDFLAAYASNENLAAEIALDSGLLLHPLQKLLASKDGHWEGSATELIQDLARFAGDLLLKSPKWPRTPHHLSGLLKRLTPSLAGAGFIVERGHRADRSKARFISIRFAESL